jgi:serine protease Do
MHHFLLRHSPRSTLGLGQTPTLDSARTKDATLDPVTPRIPLRPWAALLGCALALAGSVLWAQPPDTKTQAAAPVISTNPGAPGSSRPARFSRDWTLRQTPIVDAVQRVRDAVVNIHSERTVMGESNHDGPTGQAKMDASLIGIGPIVPSQNRINGMGTGIIIDHRGYIITNQHVVEDVNVIRVHLADGTIAGARVLSRDTESDLALLKIDVNRSLPVMPLGTASDLRVGETVIAIGNAYGYPHTVTQGVVSATGRDVTLNKEVSYKALIQTDAAINPGNSGGPLINIWGELVGVNVAIRAGAQGIGFAIPVETMVHVAGQMLRQRGNGKGSGGGSLASGLLVRDVLQERGLNPGNRNNLEPASVLTGLKKDDEPAGHGESEDSQPVRNVVVDRVEQGTVAEKAGLQRGDILLRANDLRVASSLDVERAFLDVGPGDRFRVVVRRQGTEKTLQFSMDGSRNSGMPGAELCWRRLGVKLQPVPAEEVSRANPQLHGGMLVTEVRTESTAAKNGIQRGDILVGLHDWEMLNLDNVVFVLNHQNLASFSPLRFFILRGTQVHRGFLATLD